MIHVCFFENKLFFGSNGTRAFFGNVYYTNLYVATEKDGRN